MLEEEVDDDDKATTMKTARRSVMLFAAAEATCSLMKGCDRSQQSWIFASI